jgi:hypothetical protein
VKFDFVGKQKNESQNLFHAYIDDDDDDVSLFATRMGWLGCFCTGITATTAAAVLMEANFNNSLNMIIE